MAATTRTGWTSKPGWLELHPGLWELNLNKRSSNEVMIKRCREVRLKLGRVRKEEDIEVPVL